MNRDRATLLDIERAARLSVGHRRSRTQAARLALQFVEGVDESSFLEDDKTQSAVLHQLLVIGEATKQVSPEFREENAPVPWRLMAGMRDKLIHEYDNVDLHEVWRAATRDVPELLSQMEPLLPEREG